MIHQEARRVLEESESSCKRIEKTEELYAYQRRKQHPCEITTDQNLISYSPARRSYPATDRSLWFCPRPLAFRYSIMGFTLNVRRTRGFAVLLVRISWISGRDRWGSSATVTIVVSEYALMDMLKSLDNDFNSVGLIVALRN